MSAFCYYFVTNSILLLFQVIVMTDTILSDVLKIFGFDLSCRVSFGFVGVLWRTFGSVGVQ